VQFFEISEQNPEYFSVHEGERARESAGPIPPKKEII
jgi:hypothetical protein